jgi:hypothetical protein
LFDSAVQLTKDQTYYIAVRAITDSFTLGLFEFPYGAWRTLGLIASGSKVQRASPFTGAWTNESLTSVPMVGVLLSGIDDGAGTSISGSRNIAGTVTYNGSPVSGATVRLIRQTDNATASTITNAQGQYSFSVAEGYLYHAVAEWTNSGQRYNAKSVWDLTPVA